MAAAIKMFFKSFKQSEGFVCFVSVLKLTEAIVTLVLDCQLTPSVFVCDTAMNRSETM